MNYRLYFAVILTAMILTLTGASAHNRCSEDWKKKIQAEKIAFLTSETGITPEEAQAFWPVYNKVDKDRDEAMRNVFKAYKALESAINENRSAKEIDSLLDNYLDAQKEQRKTDNEIADEYRKVLPVEKVAKIFIAEEKFRRQHIRKLHARPEMKPGSQANR